MHYMSHQDFHFRKAERTAYYMRLIHGWKLRNCSACSGSGYYDNDGSPPCGACDGTGKERYKPEKVKKFTKPEPVLPVVPNTERVTK